MADKRHKQECYFCPEKYTVDHKCATKAVYALEMDYDTYTIAIEEELGISLHALTWITAAHTIKLKVTINNIELVALVDSGSTPTFINDAIARRIGLLVRSRSEL